ncbi:MAG: cytidine deaminase [Streptosporangiaceae bacterium]
MPELDPEDEKLVTLARAARARVGAAQGGAVRDRTGRTYVAVDVALPTVALSALQLAVAMAVASGAEVLEAAAVVTEGGGPGDDDLAALRFFGPSAPLIVAGGDGAVRATLDA